MLKGFFWGLVMAVTIPFASAIADDHAAVAYTVSGSFDDVVFDLENAVVDEGLVIDYRGHVNAMLERTSEVVGSTAADGAKSPFVDATYMHFCSAALTHAAVSADPANLAICPYILFAYETRAEPGTVHVGYRRPLGGPAEDTQAALADIEALLDRIVRSTGAE